MHGHSHGHSHDADGKTGSADRDLALMRYMLEHNRQHAQELAETGGRIADAGLEQAAGFIQEAVHSFEHANSSLEKAIRAIGGEE